MNLKRILSKPQPLPTELWAVMGPEGILTVAESLTLAEELLYTAFAEDKGRDLEEVKETFTVDLKTGDWCLAVKATGYRIRDWYTTKVPAVWDK